MKKMVHLYDVVKKTNTASQMKSVDRKYTEYSDILQYLLKSLPITYRLLHRKDFLQVRYNVNSTIELVEDFIKQRKNDLMI